VDDPKDIQVEVTPQEVVVKADTHHRHTTEKGTIHRCDFVSGEAFRSVTLPKPIDVSKAKAEFEHGMLRITAPVASEAQPRSGKPTRTASPR
jgi:HSP20 family protein